LAFFIKYQHPQSRDGYIFLFTANIDRTTDKELEILVTAGYNKEEYSREELLADIL
jgi:hypothetical protein